MCTLLSAAQIAERGQRSPRPRFLTRIVCLNCLLFHLNLFLTFEGRTGRAGKSGDAFSFVCGADPSKTLRDLVELLQRAKKDVPQELRDLAFSGGGRFGGGGRGRPPPSSYNRGPSSYGGGASYGGASSAAPSYGGSHGGSSYGGPTSYSSGGATYNSAASFNHAVIASSYDSASAPAVRVGEKVGEKRARESFSTQDDDDRRYKRDDRDRDSRRDDRDHRGSSRDDYRRDDRDRRASSRDDYRRDDRDRRSSRDLPPTY
jgi:superfamily II DNA/RNA helicase